MPDKPSAGRRVMIYVPPDLLGRWDAVPRFERSALVAEALRRLWGIETPSRDTPNRTVSAPDPDESAS